MPSFRVDVDYFDCSKLTQSPCDAKPCWKPAEQSSTCTDLIRKSESVSTTDRHLAVEGSAVKFVRPPSSILCMKGADCRAMMSAVGGMVWTVFDGCMGQQSAQPGSRSSQTFMKPLPAARMTSPVMTDLSDKPQDLSVRTSARHVTCSDSSTTSTVDISGRSQRTELTGKA